MKRSDFMRLEELEIFLEVANQKSMSIAGNNLNMSPQNISVTIARLEAELEVSLFSRTRQGIFLKESGKKLYSFSKKVIEEFSTLKTDLEGQNKNAGSCVSGEIRILSSINLAFLIATLTETLQKRYPNIKILLLEQTDLCLTKRNFEDNHDIICTSYEKNFLSGYIGSPRPDDAYVLKEENLRLFFKKDDPLIKRKAISLRALKKLPLIAYCTSDSNSQIYSQLLNHKGIKLNHIFSSNNINLCVDYLENNRAYYLGTTLLFNTLFKPIQTGVTSIPLKDKISIIHVLFVRKNTSSTVKLLIDMIRNYFGHTLYEIDHYFGFKR